MTITAAIVLYAVIWFLSLLVALPIGLRTQEEDGEVAPGTPSSAPVNPMIGRKMAWVTLITTLLWALVAATIVWSDLTVRDIDFFHRM
jgi:predicted secreted protein